MPAAPRDLVLCVDFGSTWTKAGLIDLAAGRQLAVASSPTTSATDVLDGLAACRADLDRRGFGTGGVPVLACSSAGGGLRIAVVGNELAVTAEAGRRAALSSGGQVVSTVAGPFTADRWSELVRSRPDLVLLSGGTDGGNATRILAAARVLAERRCAVPVVVAGNTDAADEVAGVLTSAGVEHVVVANLVPRIGGYAPEAARAAVRGLFLSHVIGGKGLSTGPAFADLVVGATPDIVLAAVEVMGSMLPTGLAVVDVGGATTDVYSCLTPTEATSASGPSRELVAPAAASRTVEGDLGVHASAAATSAYGRAAGLIDPAESDSPPTLARAAAAAALLRHAGRSDSVLVAGKRTVRVVGPDLRAVELLVGSGGVFRADPGPGTGLLRQALSSVTGPGRLLPDRARIRIDADYLLAPIGLLAARHPEVARTLALGLTG